MRSKLIFPVLLGLVLAIAMTTAALSQESESTDPPSEVVFERPEGAATTNFAPVTFNHEAHLAEDCMVCHHTWDGASGVKSCASKGCHDDMKNREEATSYFQAFHNRHSDRSCLGCHEKMNTEAKHEGNEPMKLSPCSNNMCHVKS